MVDINQGYTAPAAIASARAMEPGGLLWIEEPVQPEDIAGYRQVSQAVPVAISGGEALGSLAAFRDFLEARALSILQPDIGVCGGFSGLQRIAHLAAAYDLPVLPHVFGTAVNFHASLHMAALLPARKGGGPLPYPYVEYDATDNPLAELFGFPVEQDGHAALPDKPGLGFDLEPSRLEPWTVERWTVNQGGRK
jgi:D-galactarolactone cycloisomerase